MGFFNKRCQGYSIQPLVKRHFAWTWQTIDLVIIVFRWKVWMEHWAFGPTALRTKWTFGPNKPSDQNAKWPFGPNDTSDQMTLRTKWHFGPMILLINDHSEHWTFGSKNLLDNESQEQRTFEAMSPHGTNCKPIRCFQGPDNLGMQGFTDQPRIASIK